MTDDRPLKEYKLTPPQVGSDSIQPGLFADDRWGELVLANIDIAIRHGREDLAAGEPPHEVFERTLAFVRGFVSGRFYLIVPPEMDPEGYAQAIELGKELAEKYGWGK